ncbi:MAG TPA: type II toxin-antitoxin system prevent-host-death family antitoxin [Gammaproteobacteria bacterium]|nr:type II toxin-antitoxin system prevent-host-death family antitoxin [Gammaproteobacteria bacterium]
MEIGAYQAKTHLPQLLARVEKGEHFVITRHGSPIAELLPISRPDKEKVAKTLSAIREQRARYASQGITLSELTGPDKTLRELMHDDHRY